MIEPKRLAVWSENTVVSFSNDSWGNWGGKCTERTEGDSRKKVEALDLETLFRYAGVQRGDKVLVKMDIEGGEKIYLNILKIRVG